MVARWRTPLVSDGAATSVIVFVPLIPRLTPWKSMDASPPTVVAAFAAVLAARPPKLIETAPPPLWLDVTTFVAPRNAVSQPRFCTDPALLPV